MIRVASKNTFIDIAVSDDDEVDDPLPRARSAEDVWSRKLGDGLNDLARQSLQRLNAVLSIGITGGAKSSPQQISAIEEEPLKEQQDSSSDESVSELHSLKERLGNALVEKSQKRNTFDELRSLQERLGRALQVPSFEEQSRMAYADTPERGPISQALHPTRMRQSWSSGSISTMASEYISDGEADFSPYCSNGTQGVEEFSSPPMVQMRSGEKTIVGDDCPTTVTICNIPSRYSQRDLMYDLNAAGFSGTIDFLFMPIGTNTLANVGSAFVNFVDAASAARCMVSFQNHPFKRYQRRRSCKTASVSVAPIQGLKMNLQHYYESAAVNASSAARRRPIVMSNNSSER
jgi:hypothetical protein